MNRMLFHEVEDLFAKAVGYDEPMRQRFLEQVGRDHSREIRDLLERLLSRDQSQTRWTDLGSSLVNGSEPPEPQPTGKILDRFRLIERLGVGGHGEVYLAEQIEPVNRQVALKMVRPGMTNEHSIARFRAEQQALAKMNHRGIAAVYEAGLADHGRLFFAMEYIDGQPIDVYCDQQRLNIRQRLDLFLKVCQSVQHAHQRGLIHRDLKPTNIIVTERDGETMPVLIDFGIALATEPETGSDDDESNHDARRRAVIGTPAYMSPEQAGGNNITPDDVDTRSDIYALGIVLFELLTGRTPFDVLVPRGASQADIRRAIIECPPYAPRQMVDRNEPDIAHAAINRSATVRSLRRQVKGDLDAIVVKAIARDRANRYQTVDALAADIRNVLDDRPVSAAETSVGRRASKFVRRHRYIVGGSVTAALLMIAAITGTTLGMVRAERAARESETISTFLQDLLVLSRADEKGSTVRFVDVLADGSAMARERFSAYPEHEARIRYILGHTYYSLGMFADARGQLEQAHALMRDSIGESNPLTLTTAILLAQALVQLNERDEAVAIATDVLQRTADARSDPLRLRNLRAQWLLADILITRGKYAEAEQRLRALLPLIDAHNVAQRHSAEERAGDTASNARISLARTLNAQSVMTSEPDRERALKQEVVRILSEVIDRERTGGTDQAAIKIASPTLFLAEVLIDLRRFNEAANLVAPLLPAVRERFGTAHWLYTNAAAAHASLLFAHDDLQGAADLMLEITHRDSDESLRRNHQVITRARDALVYLDAAGRAEEGLRLARTHHQTFVDMVGPTNPMTREAQLWLARFCDQSGLNDEAARHYSEAMAIAGETSRPQSPRMMLFHAGHLARAGEFEVAESLLHELVDVQGDISAGTHRVVKDEIARMFAEVYRAWGREADAAEYDNLARELRSR